ncbi:MAG: VOC family protein [candidate division Zixibacteria bacterium]|nr:VOC family protein [candidate division Zixibacteria bacterium]
MPRVAHFEIPATEPERAVQFYENVFGWKIEKWEGPMEYWLVTTGEAPEPGIDGAIMRQTGGDVTTNVVDVPDVDEYARRVEAAGGKVVGPKTAVPGVGWFVLCADTEGNVFGIMQEDPSAK